MSKKAAAVAPRFMPGSREFSYEDFPFYWIARVHLTYTQKLERILKRLGTDNPTRCVLLMLNRHGTLSISDLALHSVIKSPTMVRIVQRMRKEGLVETATNAEDARITDVALTAAGSELLNRIHAASARIFDQAFAGLSEAQLDRLNHLLAGLYRNLDEI